MNFLNKPMMIDAVQFKALSNVEWIESENFGLTYNTYDSVAVIPIHGLLSKRSEPLAPIFGTTSYEEIYNAIRQAHGDAEVASILLDIDSPGGEVGGLFDLMDFIYESRNIKPIHAYANDCACSAGYAIASATSKVFISRTSMVGSIGVIAVHSDVSEAEKKAGIKYTTVFAGAKKNDLSPHEPITDRAIADLQNEVDRIYQMFVKTVARNRGISEKTVRNTEAGVFYGENAMEMSLADELVCIPFRFGGENAKIDEFLMKGEIGMKTENKEAVGNVVADAYKAEILEIAKLCKLSHAEQKMADFIMQGLTVEQVKEKLLDSMNSKEEITSSIYQKSEKAENPVIAVARQRAQARK